MMSDARIEEGDTVTIEGYMRGKNGQIVYNGRNVKTNRKCKGVEPMKFVIAAVVTDTARRFIALEEVAS